MSLWRSVGGSGASGSGAPQSGSSSAHELPPPEEVDLLRKGGSSAVLRACTEPPLAEEGDCQADQVLLDASREVLEEVELTPSTVLLHVYDLNEGLKRANEVLTFSSERLAVGGAFHVGVEVYGSEWSYGSYGVCSALPRTAPGHIYQCSVLLGPTELELLDFVSVLRELCCDWGAAEYAVLGQNCCSFAAELVERLGVGPMPPWVNRFSKLGQDARDSWTSLRSMFTQPQGSTAAPGPAGEGGSWLGGLVGRLVSSGGAEADTSDSESEPDLAAGAVAAWPAPARPRTLVLLGRPAGKLAVQLRPAGGRRGPPTPQRALAQPGCARPPQGPPSPATGSKATQQSPQQPPQQSPQQSPQQLLQPQPPKPAPSRPGAGGPLPPALSRAGSFSLKQPGTPAQPPQPNCSSKGSPSGGAPQQPQPLARAPRPPGSGSSASAETPAGPPPPHSRHHAQGCSPSAELPPAPPPPPRLRTQGCSASAVGAPVSPPARHPAQGCSVELPVGPAAPPRHHAQGCSASAEFLAGPPPPRHHAHGCSASAVGPPVSPPLGQQPQRMVHSPWGSSH